MPEAVEVHFVSEVLNNHLKGKRLVDGNIYFHSRYYKYQKFDGMEKLTPGLKLTQVFPRGKKIIFQFENEIYMVSTLLMEGNWSFQINEKTAISLTFADQNDQLETAYYRDTRKFGSLAVYLGQQELLVALKDVGPDLLHDQISFDQYCQVIKKKSLVNKPIQDFLLDQSRFSGIGNYLKSEILYLSRLHPDRKLGSLSDLDLTNLYKSILYILSKAFQARGLSFGSYIDPDGNKGTYQPLVYMKEQDPEGNLVVRTKTNRTTHWVPTIQI